MILILFMVFAEEELVWAVETVRNVNHHENVIKYEVNSKLKDKVNLSKFDDLIESSTEDIRITIYDGMKKKILFIQGDLRW